MISRNGIGEIHPANLQMTAADVAAIAMIKNNAMWIHGLIKHCLRSWTGKFGHFYACVREMTAKGRPLRENMSKTSAVSCSAMQVKQRGREPWIQIG